MSTSSSILTPFELSKYKFLSGDFNAFASELANGNFEIICQKYTCPIDSKYKKHTFIVTVSEREIYNEEEQIDTNTEYIIKLPDTTPLEICKIKFFAGDLDSFSSELVAGNFNIYHGEYIYSSDYDERPPFIVRNLVNGFVHQLDDKHKYLLIFN